MKILYIANHQAGGNEDEKAIAHALRQIGHDVQEIPESRGSYLRRIKADMMLFHKWYDLDTLRALEGRILRVFWYFDLVEYNDITLERRNQTRRSWMQDVIPNVDLGFCTDGDWVRSCQRQGLDKIHWLPQGADERVVGRASVEAPGSWKILFTGIRKGGKGRESFVDEMTSRYGQDFLNVQHGMHGRKLADLIARSRIVVAPDHPCTDYYWCVDKDTEILTSSGWKTYDKLAVGEEVYTLNHVYGTGEWQPLLDVSIFPEAKRDLVSIESKTHSSLTTQNHRWPIVQSTTEYIGLPGKKLRRTTKRATRESKNFQRQDRIITAATCRSIPEMETYPDELVELIAWTWTEGSRGDGLYKLISQSHRVNNQYVSRIRNCLTRLYGPGKTDSLLHYKLFPAWRELKNELKGMTAFSFNNHIGKLLWSLAPGGIASLEFIKKLTLKQLNLFINSSVDADGCRTGDRGRCRFAQKEEPRIASLEFACVLAGITTTRKRREDVWVMNLSGRQYSTPLRSDLGNITTVRESGIVWCPTTKNGTWLARRNGKIYFTGNSNRVYNALGFGAFLLHPYCTGLASTYIGGLDLLYYEDRRDLHNLIAEYMDRPEKREEIAINGLSVTIHSHLYRHRCEELMGVVNARRRQQPRILEKETGSGKEG